MSRKIVFSNGKSRYFATALFFCKSFSANKKSGGPRNLRKSPKAFQPSAFDPVAHAVPDFEKLP
jgi:hypothetical protein